MSVRPAAEVGCSRTTVKRNLEVGDWVAYPKLWRARRLDGPTFCTIAASIRRRAAGARRLLGRFAVLPSAIKVMVFSLQPFDEAFALPHLDAAEA